jgi:hypothetical protein
MQSIIRGKRAPLGQLANDRALAARRKVFLIDIQQYIILRIIPWRLGRRSDA